MKKFRRPSHSTVVAYLALFLALGTGGAYAANTIGSEDVIDDSLKSVDIKNSEVKGVDINSNSVNSPRVINDSLLGADINEFTLDGVDADKVAGGTACRSFNTLGLDPGDIFGGSLCSSGSVRIFPKCTEVDVNFIRAELLVDTGVDDSFYGGTTLDANFNAADPPAQLLVAQDKDDPGAAMAMHEVVAGTASNQIAGVAAVRAERGEPGSDCEFIFYGAG